MDDIYLCVRNRFNEFSCSSHDSFEHADAHYKQKLETGNELSTMIPVSKLWPKPLISDVLRYKLSKTFISVKMT